MKKISLLFCVLLSVATLAAQKNAFTITYGSTGGFTGGTASYSFSNDGILYKQEKFGSNLQSAKQKVTKLKKKDVKEIQQLIKDADFDALHVNTPGNLVQFVNLTENGKEYKTSWGGTSSGSTALDTLYKKLNSLIATK